MSYPSRPSVLSNATDRTTSRFTLVAPIILLTAHPPRPNAIRETYDLSGEQQN
jgi:hypothetical protein